jgi:hypothetical protein
MRKSCGKRSLAAKRETNATIGFRGSDPTEPARGQAHAGCVLACITVSPPRGPRRVSTECRYPDVTLETQPVPPMPDATLEVVRGEGHLFSVTRLREVGSRILRFLTPPPLRVRLGALA